MTYIKKERKNATKRIAVVGAGIFGLTAALKLDELGFNVDVFEKNADILRGASGANQFRSHRGYHYPRSPETIESCKRSTPRFEDIFAGAIIKGVKRYYAIASNGSRVSADEYLGVLNEYGLPYRVSNLPFLDPSRISLTIEVEENAIDIDELKRILRKRIAASGIRLHLNTPVMESDVADYDMVVVAGYGQLNEFFRPDSKNQNVYQYELCEKPVVRLPREFKDMSLVVMDGPFFCLDPYGTTGLHLLGSVEHAIHYRETSKNPSFPEPIRKLLHSGVVVKPRQTKINDFLALIRGYIPTLKEVEHVGSFFTVRSVLPFKDDTDERPTIVRKLDNRTVTVFSGKIGTCIDAAEEIAAIAEGRVYGVAAYASAASKKRATSMS